ncbi:glycosyltransferase family 4 protein [Aquitalea aquatica]|uniref:Glycosyltransferase family 4 protein n=1 Tax=Aquitalea aquatica TaxID=3044273 RepID=A0A838XYT9_9NEIS|nr:glycosyltransferase family 4 protein [Aquitalea magnusonii]MBA4706818.1 glycosyltransferase family 4 protein [Aquitalea magnusonii]
MSRAVSDMLTIVHLTAHLGGGVGKAMCSLVAGSGQGVKHHFLCLERPEKQVWIEQLRALGALVSVCPDREQLVHILQQADVVQLEWWNHPATLHCLAGLDAIPMRLVSWCHVSGLFNPVLPLGLLEVCDQVVLTSACSLQAEGVAKLQAERPHRFRVISSGSGLANQAVPQRSANQPLRAGYLGSLNFSKLHPRYVEYFHLVADQTLAIRMAGDVLNQTLLQAQAASIGRPGLLQFEGFTSRPGEFLSQINVLPYLLNPTHYGTAENALLEAMAMGVLPIVLANAAEQAIVQHGQTGFVIESAQDMADVLHLLQQNPERRLEMGLAAARQVRAQFTDQAMAQAFAACYQDLLSQDKSTHAFSQAIGSQPAQWFLSCQPQPQQFLQQQWGQLLSGDGRYAVLEQTKGSVFHFHDCFPDNEQLSCWSKALACISAN